MRKRLLATIMVLAGGCQTTQTSIKWAPRCTGSDDVAVDRTAPTSLGVSWEDLAADTGAEDRRETTLTWYDYAADGPGAQTELVVEVVPAEASAHEVRYECDFAHCTDGMKCPDPYAETRIETAATLSFATGDGAFQESWPVTLSAVGSDLVEAELRIDGADLQGGLREQLALGADEEFELSLWFYWASAAGSEPPSFHGALHVLASRYDQPDGKEGDGTNPMADW